ncbi:neuroligin-4, X-linked-like [Centruroides sculpturatus]|uniref:neuroligin-4, X-linked-like n=1 Tax=Centruroides sculpturatus TaxID=218467 RepID=UPI000C6CBB96|nr:neuroligin-4, X-linked-like [Centruroides sculpturatus]
MKSITNTVCLLCVICSLKIHVLTDRRPSTREVITKYGALRGTIVTFPNRPLKPVEVFLGIPYASAPVGSLRFMPPVTPPHWKNVKNADHFGSVCPQRLPDITNETEALRRMPWGRLQYLRRLLPYLVNQSEDCLYLNIYTPASVKEGKSKLPVMVYIHGESYEWNSGNPYDGSILASFGSVVVVTINFRLGVLGFLPALDSTSRGNYGLMDQVAALHWIQENIGGFGGDNSNVTIFGHGHGAACVNLLMISPMTKGLFQRAIMQSGSALSPWAVATEAHTYTKFLVKQLGCPMEEKRTLLECLRQRPIADIMQSTFIVPDHLTSFGPTVDGVVVPSVPIASMSSPGNLYGQYDMMAGVCRIEWYFGFSSTEERSGIDTKRRDRILRTLVRNLFSYHLQEIFLTIVNEYTDWTKPKQEPMDTLLSTADAMSDALIVSSLSETVNFHSSGIGRTFYYVFTHQTEKGDYYNDSGCIHGEEVPYIFGAPLVGNLAHFKSDYSRSEVTLSETVMSYWTNFAKTGDVNGDAQEYSSDKGKGPLYWPQYKDLQQKYMSLATKSKVRDHYHAHRLSFWLSLIPKLHKASGSEPQHHLLEDHDNQETYDGIVRRAPSDDTVRSPGSTDATPTVSYYVPSSPATETSYSVLETSTESLTSGNPVSDSIAVTSEPTRYTTALSVTIAIGCSLLILNVLIFAGVYYQRDKREACSDKMTCGVGS